MHPSRILADGRTACAKRVHTATGGSWKTFVFCATATTSLCATVILGKVGWIGIETTGFEILRCAL